MTDGHEWAQRDRFSGECSASVTTNTVAWYASGERWKFCASCATKIGDDWRYCAGCGTAVGCISQGVTTQPYAWPFNPQWPNPYITWGISPTTYTIT